MKNYFLLLASANVQPFLNMDSIKSISIPLPPKNVQNEIISFINSETNHIDSLMGKIEESIERLREYRGALISAAVKGKIDVRG